MNTVKTKTYTNLTYIFKTIFFYLFAFLLFYFQPLKIGGLTVGILWKIIFLAAISLPVSLYVFKRKLVEPFVLFAVLLSLKMLFNLSSFEYFNSTISLVAKSLMFPMLYLFFVIKLNSKQLIYFAKHFSIFLIISFVPFMLGILDQVSEGYDLSIYGLEDSFGLIGLSQNAHGASITVGFSLIVLFYFFNVEKNKYMKLIYLGLLGLGVYELINTYVRTGMMLAFIGIFYLWIKERGKTKFLTAILFILPIAFFSFYLYQTDPAFKMRMNDENIYHKKQDTIEADRIGSGRLVFAQAALYNWYTEGFSSRIIGLGMVYGLDKMEKAIGNRIFAHNGFIQILQQEGLVGFFLFLLYLYSLLMYISKRKTNKYHDISMALTLAYIAQTAVQGHFIFPIVLLLVIFLALMKKTESVNGG